MGYKTRSEQLTNTEITLSPAEVDRWVQLEMTSRELTSHILLFSLSLRLYLSLLSVTFLRSYFLNLLRLFVVVMLSVVVLMLLLFFPPCVCVCVCVCVRAQVPEALPQI